MAHNITCNIFLPELTSHRKDLVLIMNEELYEVNEFQVTLFFTLKALYYDFGESLPSNIGKKFEELIDLVSEYLDVDNGHGDIVKEQYYRKVVYEDQ